MMGTMRACIACSLIVLLPEKIMYKNWQHILHKAWYQGHPLLHLLRPFAGLFACLVALRRFCYHQRLKSVTHFPVPVIVVGNITFGGTGKTPLVVWLADFLLKAGYQPGLVSRGYGGRSAEYPLVVTPQSDPSMVGDEAVLLAGRTKCPMVVAPCRVTAVTKLLRDYACDIVISDDGLQHYALGRAIEIAVIDGERRLGNGWCLPAGPLRESQGRLQKVDWVVTNGRPAWGEYGMQLVPSVLRHVADPEKTLPLSEIIDKTIHAVAGIGHPQRFFQTLRELGLNIIEHPFPDHYRFKRDDILYGDDALVIMTEKDAVKCRAWATPQHWYLPVEAVLEPKFTEVLLEKLREISAKKKHLA